ncbi:hypothetical protein ACFO0N_10625 [Halobium salinum]|uniref:Transcriptional regulator n=1 Tax=Halobium salinum TaxID=1364940 RepID=A0ABD5PD41_9EURY|nr:hypothetical protein [Halobium salinum]
MYNPTLTAADRQLLGVLGDGPAPPASLVAVSDAGGPTVHARLRYLADNGLVRRQGAAYELTADGRRLLRAPSEGDADDAVALPDPVVRALDDRGLVADRRAAVEAAYGFLRYWGTATGPEIADGVFSEVPLGYETPAAWWEGFVRDQLVGLPGVETPDAAVESAGVGLWRFAGRPGVADLDEPGRRLVFGRGETTPRSYACATEALVHLGVTDDRRLAVAAALGRLQREQRRANAADGSRSTDRRTDPRGVPGETLLTVAAAATAGDDTLGDAWLHGPLFDVLERLPGVVRAEGRYRYTLTPGGYEPAGGRLSRTSPSKTA